MQCRDKGRWRTMTKFEIRNNMAYASQIQEESSATQSELSTNALLEINDLKSKVCRLTEQSTKLDGDVSFLSKLSTQIELLENQIIKWRYRFPELADDESQEKIVSAVEVQEELDELKDVVYRKLKEMLTSLNNLRESVRLIENDKEESWEAISHKVSTLIEDSVGLLTDRLRQVLPCQHHLYNFLLHLLYQHRQFL